MKNSVRFLSILVLGLTYQTFVLISKPSIQATGRPPLHQEFEAIQLDTYWYYDKNKTWPSNLDYLSARLRSLVNDGKSGITWDEEAQTFHYKYPRLYPLNVPLIRYYSFGLISGKAPHVAGASIGPELAAHNTDAFLKAGKL